MKLINGQKRADFLKAENSKTSQVTADEIKEFPQSYMIAAFSDGVIKGIKFAETELQTLAIEFANYCADSRLSWLRMQKDNLSGFDRFSTGQLFSKFLTERNKS